MEETKSETFKELTDEERKIAIKERRSGIWEFAKKNYIWGIYILLIILLVLNVQIRTMPLDINPITGKPGLWNVAIDDWTLGPDLDPFVFLRGAERIIEDGTLGEKDMLRFYPLGYNTIGETKILPYSIAYIHKAFVFLGISDSVTYAAIWLPVLFSIITALAFFFLVRRIFEDKGKFFSNITALIGTSFLITLPSLLPRTIAGIPEKESMGFAFMFLAFYFFISAWKAKGNEKFPIKNFILATLAGLFTALMGLVWGGVIFIYITIALTGFIFFLMEKIHKKEMIVYWTWLLTSMLFWIPFTARMSVRTFMTASSTGGAIVIGIIMIWFMILYKTKYFKFIEKIPKFNKIPRVLQTLIISAVLFTIILSIFFGPIAAIDMGKGVIGQLISPYSSRIAFTVAENKQPYFTDWRGNMGPIIEGFPILFWLFFIGSVVLFHEVIRNYKLYERTILITSYVIFLICLIFSRSSPNDILNGESGIALIMYAIGFIALVSGISYVIYKRLKEGKSLEVNANIGYIFVFSLVFVGIIAGRSAIRLLMVLLSIVVIPVSYIIVNSVYSAIEKKDEEVLKLLSIIFAIIIVIAGIMVLNYQYQGIKIGAKNHIPSVYTYQWQYAMKWVDENTPQDAVFGHWWDYGYWVQSMGHRATMLDGGNSIPYWNYLMGRHVLTAESEQEALNLGYAHNLTHFLIDSTEIGKYAAYSSIGSDEKYDRLSWIGTFHLDEKQTVETANDTSIVYVGGIALDEDLVINDSEYLPSQKTGIGAIIVMFSQQTSEITGAFIITIYNGKQMNIPLRYVYFEGQLIDFGEGSGIEGAAYIIPRFIDGEGYNSRGSALFLSPRNMRALWVQMYLLNNVEHFELIHVEDNNVVKSLKSQGIQSRELIYYRGLQGPIKIWELKYTGEEEFNEEYLMLDFPEHLLGRKYK